METTLLLGILVIVIIILMRQKNNNESLNEKTRYIYTQLNELKSQIDQLHNIPKQAIDPDNSTITIANDTSESINQQEEVLPDSMKEETPILTLENASINTEPILEDIESTSIALGQHDSNQEIEILTGNNSSTETESSRQHEHQEAYAHQTEEVPKSWFENFKEKNPDLEKFIGENLINKIGILILVLGISFFVKYAIDKDWINEPGRVGIGILSGAIVMGLAHRLRANYSAFSSILVAGAISIFYLTIGIAFHDYRLFNQTTAFFIMVVITIFSSFVSISYNRKELAILSLIGGFAVPFMVSTGSGNYHVLLSYMAILNIGMLIISYSKKWNVVSLLTFIATWGIYLFWFNRDPKTTDFPFQGALLYAIIYYLIFSIAPILNNIRKKGKFSAMEYGILLANNFLYFATGAVILETWMSEFKGLFTLTLALYNLLFAIILYKKFGVHRNAIYFLLALVLTFVTITIPFQFDGNYITLFWACESVILIWLSQKSKIPVFKVGGIIVQNIMVISLLIDWSIIYYSNNTILVQPFINKIFLTGIVAIVSIILVYKLFDREKEPTIFYSIKIDPKQYKIFAFILSIAVGYMVGLLEVRHQSYQYLSNTSSALSCTMLYHYVFSAILIYYLFKNKTHTSTAIASTLAIFNLILYITFVYRLSNQELQMNFFDNSHFKIAFINHYLILCCIAYYLYTLFIHRKDPAIAPLLDTKPMLWLFICSIVYIFSTEVMTHTLIFSSYGMDQAQFIQKYLSTGGTVTLDLNVETRDILHDIKIQVIKIGYPILWGIISFIILIIGIRKQHKLLRIIALSLLGLTILKLFLYDIKNVSETGKIIAFILLGVLILIISFVYQKIKKLVIDGAKPIKDEDSI